MKFALLTFCFLLAPSARAGNNAVNDSCKRLCESGSDCVQKCVGQAELFELKSDFINAVTDWTKTTEIRLMALRSGANTEILDLCKRTGWSMENMMICLRSYPTPDVIKNCKKLSPRQEEQVRCMRAGKTGAEVEACTLMVPGADSRLTCLESHVTAQETRICHHAGGDTYEKIKCVKKAEFVRLEEARRYDLETRIRVERGKMRGARSLSSSPPSRADSL